MDAGLEVQAEAELDSWLYSIYVQVPRCSEVGRMHGRHESWRKGMPRMPMGSWEWTHVYYSSLFRMARLTPTIGVTYRVMRFKGKKKHEQ